jgi:hypothetical protein
MRSLRAIAAAHTSGALFALETGVAYWLTKLLAKRGIDATGGGRAPMSSAVAWAGVDFLFVAAAVSVGVKLEIGLEWSRSEVVLWYSCLCIAFVLILRSYGVVVKSVGTRPTPWRELVRAAGNAWLGVTVGLVPVSFEALWLAKGKAQWNDVGEAAALACGVGTVIAMVSASVGWGLQGLLEGMVKLWLNMRVWWTRRQSSATGDAANADRNLADYGNLLADLQGSELPRGYRKDVFVALFHRWLSPESRARTAESVEKEEMLRLLGDYYEAMKRERGRRDRTIGEMNGKIVDGRGIGMKE